MVSGGPSVACRNAKEVEWDDGWVHNLDPSGRAALGVHASTYEEYNKGANNGPKNGRIDTFNNMPRVKDSIGTHEVLRYA